MVAIVPSASRKTFSRKVIPGKSFVKMFAKRLLPFFWIGQLLQGFACILYVTKSYLLREDSSRYIRAAIG